jgi:phosphoserine phosphatase
MTDAAMRGELPLEAVYGRRLELIRPNRTALEALAGQYVRTLVPHARDVVRALHDEGIAVCIMSGGLRPAVLAAAQAVGIAAERVAAVDIHFDADGAYAGYDAGSPLTRSGGKVDVIRTWREEVPGEIMMVGDGITDLEVRDDVDLFVAYAGVVEREAVVAAADAVIRSASLAPVLPLALGRTRPAPAARGLYDLGVHLLENPNPTSAA